MKDWTFIWTSLMILVSLTKLTLGLRVGFISSHLTADKLFLVNSRAITGPPDMSLLLEAKSTPALIIKYSLWCNTGSALTSWQSWRPDNLAFWQSCMWRFWTNICPSWLDVMYQPAETDVRSKSQQDCQKAKCYARADPVLHHRLYSKDLMFQVIDLQFSFAK